MQWVLKQWFHKKNFSGSRKFFFTGSECTLNFLFFHSDGNNKNFLEPEMFFFTRCTCFESNFCPPRFLNLINSPRLNCKDSPRTSSALALNYADAMEYQHFHFLMAIPGGYPEISHSNLHFLRGFPSYVSTSRLSFRSCFRDFKAFIWGRWEFPVAEMGICHFAN